MITAPTPAPVRHSEQHSEGTVHFRPQRRRYTQPSVLMTLSRFAPMIDMSFLLLVFFITTTRFAAPEGLLSSQMPAYGAGGSGPVIALPLTPLVMRIGAEGADRLGATQSRADHATCPPGLPSAGGD